MIGKKLGPKRLLSGVINNKKRKVEKHCLYLMCFLFEIVLQWCLLLNKRVAQEFGNHLLIVSVAG